MHNVIVTTEKNGKTEHRVVRQMPHDKPVKIGGRLFGGLITGIRPQEEK